MIFLLGILLIFGWVLITLQARQIRILNTRIKNLENQLDDMTWKSWANQ